MTGARHGGLAAAARRPATRPRILAVGEALSATGYARVLGSLFTRLRHEFDILQLGLGYRGAPVDCGWRIEPNRLTGDRHGRETLPGLAAAFRPDLVLMCHDAWLYGPLAPVLARAGLARRTLFYLPVEGPFPAPELLADLAGVGRIVCYTRFGREIVASSLQACLAAGRIAAVPPIDVVPHGVDTAVFRPLGGAPTAERLRQGRRQARHRLFPDRPELRDAFIVLNANRNWRRKRIDLTLEAFTAFARRHAPDAYLYLHMGMVDCGVDVVSIARALGIEARLLVTTPSAQRPRLPDDELNLVYNACDVGINTAAGEGWGLVAFEHAATGAAQLVPDHGPVRELWEDAAVRIPLRDPPDAGAVDVDALAAALGQLHADRGRLQRWSALAFHHVTQPRFGWDSAAGQWRRLLRAVLSPGGPQLTQDDAGEPSGRRHTRGDGRCRRTR